MDTTRYSGADDTGQQELLTRLGEHAELLRRAATALSAQEAATRWLSPAALRVQGEVGECVRMLRWSAARYDEAALAVSRSAG